MGFGHRVYRAYDPRAAALRKVAEGMSDMAEWLDIAVKVEDVVLRVFGELKPDRIIKTNVEYYAAAVLQGVGLPVDLFPPRLGRSRDRAGLGRQADPPGRSIRRPGRDGRPVAGRSLASYRLTPLSRSGARQSVG